MRPALSVILLTTLIGAGQGLLLAMIGVETAAAISGTPVTELRSWILAGCTLCLLLTALGLLASFFHLGRPARAWRAVAAWRTSWLSREVLALPAFMSAVCAYGLAHLLGGVPTLPVGFVAAVLCVVLFVCTGMIYAAIRFIREWASPLTVLNFALLGIASGLSLASSLAALLAPSRMAWLAAMALAVTLTGWLSRTAALVRNARLRPTSTLQTAIGIRHPKIVQKSLGAMGGTFNTREFFHGVALPKMRLIRRGFPILAFGVPALLLAVGLSTGLAAVYPVAFLVQFVGLLLERWFFFAQANHPQNLYYQTIS